MIPEEKDLFVVSESYRTIYDNEEARYEAQRILKETDDVKLADDFCKKILLKERAQKLLQKSKMDRRFSQRTFENFEVFDETTKISVEKAKSYCEHIEEYLKKGTNLIIEGMGKIGTGKTHLACAVAHEVIKKGIPARFINVVSMISEIKENFDISEFTTVELLIIDDLGKEKGTEWVRETIYAIVNRRYEKMLPTVITTEKSMTTMTNHYGEQGKAILSRISEDFCLIRLNGEDYRLRRNK